MTIRNITVSIDGGSLDEAAKKAKELLGLLQQIKQLLEDLKV